MKEIHTIGSCRAIRHWYARCRD